MFISRHLLIILIGWIALIIIAPVPSHASKAVRVPILMYHAVSELPAKRDPRYDDLWVAPENFRCQLQWLRENGYQSITPNQLYDAIYGKFTLPEKPILFTFDDGYADAGYNVAPALVEHGFTGTFFIVTDWVDEERGGFLSWADVKSLHAAGMTIGSHSARHMNMIGRSDAWLDAEIGRSIEAIEQNIGVRPTTFCYPFGKYDSAVIRALNRTQVPLAFTTNDGLWANNGNLKQLPRVRVRGDTSLARFVWLMTRQMPDLTTLPPCAAPTPTTTPENTPNAP